ncbi:MAG: hypothetical protein JNJ81_05690 [Candidatus Accumulibacter sp.]|uniref:Mut7-C RNAse domain-containing protein n=1 Tax=Accumulibacter sp. TaxID=2053492 RepID=UPI001A3D12A8|nr:hypothetical protein [Accumulibacter sp.]
MNRQRALAGDRQDTGNRTLAIVRSRNRQHFTFCSPCARVFWQGSRWQRMRQLLDTAMRQGSAASEER